MKLEFTSDSCAVFVQCDKAEVETLGGYIAGTKFEGEGNFYFAMVGAYPNEDLSEEYFDEFNYECRKEVEAEAALFGLNWVEA